MSLTFRTVRMNKWHPKEEFSWLLDEEIQADPVTDLQTSENTLSVWLIDDNRSNLNRIVAAYAATRQSIQNVDFVIFDSKILSQPGISTQNTIGETPDEHANKNWHCDLTQLSAQKLTQLAEIILSCDEPQRISKSEIEHLLRQSLNSGYIDSGSNEFRIGSLKEK